MSEIPRASLCSATENTLFVRSIDSARAAALPKSAEKVLQNKLRTVEAFLVSFRSEASRNGAIQ